MLKFIKNIFYGLSLLAFVVSFQNCAGEGDLSSYTSSGSSSSSGSGEEGNGNEGSQVELKIDDQTEATVARFVGDSVDLSVTVSGSQNIEYQWYKDGVAINGAINAILSLQSLAVGDTGVYYAIARDEQEVVQIQSDNIQLTVSADPKITVYNSPGYFFQNNKYVIYNFMGQTPEQAALWRQRFCINEKGVGATVEAFEFEVFKSEMRYAIMNSQCPIGVGFYVANFNNGFCALFNPNGTSANLLRLYKSITCREP